MHLYRASALVEPLKTNDVLDLIREQIKTFDDVKIYYALKQYKFKPFRKKSIELVKVCLAIESLGLPITSDLVNPFTQTEHYPTTRLHVLGDKHVLILKRKLGHRFHEWVMHPAFKQLIR